MRTVWTCVDSAAVHKVSEVTYRNIKRRLFTCLLAKCIFCLFITYFILICILYYGIRTWPECGLVLVPHANHRVTSG